MRKRKRKIKVTDVEGKAEQDGLPTDADVAVEQAPPAADVAETSAAAESEPLSEADTLRAKVEELNDKHLRAVAELQNFRRRATTEKQDAVRYASADLIRALLPVADDLERSLAAAEDDSGTSLAEGVKLVHQNLLKAFETYHVERIASVGQPFDPALHEAMMQQPSDEHDPGTVLEEYQAGYKLWDRVLRHAKVIVSASSAQPKEDQELDEAARSEGKD